MRHYIIVSKGDKTAMDDVIAMGWHELNTTGDDSPPTFYEAEISESIYVGLDLSGVEHSHLEIAGPDKWAAILAMRESLGAVPKGSTIFPHPDPPGES